MSAASDLIEQRWIPVTERMPEPFTDICIRLDRGHGYEVEAYYCDTLNSWAVGINLHPEASVTHWKPQPLNAAG